MNDDLGAALWDLIAANPALMADLTKLAKQPALGVAASDHQT